MVFELFIKEIVVMVFSVGGMDFQFVIKWWGWMCVVVRVFQKGLFKGGVILDVSNIGVMYFMEFEFVIYFNNEEI